MFIRLLLLFTLVPLLELYLLILLGQRVGALPTILLVVSTGFFGVLLAKAQGLLVLYKIGEQLRYGELPGDELMNGTLILIGAAFLLTPGLITDTLGFLLLFPGSRTYFRRYIKRKLKKALDMGTLHIFWS